MGETTKIQWAAAARVVASNGYVLRRVGRGHHLADVRGYAYEHRLVAEEKIGRRLLPGEQVHHVDHNKKNNDPANLEVEESAAHHRVAHRRRGASLRMPGESNVAVACECGCGDRILRFDSSGRPRRYVTGHNPPRTKISAADVAEIRRRSARGEAGAALALAFGVSRSQVSNIINGRQRRA